MSAAAVVGGAAALNLSITTNAARNRMETRSEKPVPPRQATAQLGGDLPIGLPLMVLIVIVLIMAATGWAWGHD